MSKASSSTLIAAAVGLAVDAAVIVKATQAFIMSLAPIPNSGPLPAPLGALPGVLVTLLQTVPLPVPLVTQVDSKGSVEVKALSHERLVSLSMAGSSGGLAAVAASVDAYVVTVVTRAFIGGLLVLTPDSTNVRAEGNVIVSADEQLTLDLIHGGISSNGALGAGASPEVAVVIKLTEAYIGTGVSVSAKAKRGTTDVAGGAFDITYSPAPDDPDDTQTITNPGTSGSSVIDKVRHFIDSVVDLNVAPPGELNGANVTSPDDPDSCPDDPEIPADCDLTDADTDPNAPVNDQAMTMVRTASAGSKAVAGIAVTAVNQDDIATVAIAGAASGLAAAAVSGGLVVVVATTQATIGASAQINQGDQDDADVSQSVLVNAANDLFRLGIVVALSGAFGVSATVGAALTAAVLTTAASVDAGDLTVKRDLLVIADSDQKVITVTVGAAAGGLAGVGGGVHLFLLVSTTKAQIGSLGLIMDVDAGGSVLVSATDDTLVVAVVGNVVLSGVAGAGVSASVTLIVKLVTASVGSLLPVPVNNAADRDEHRRRRQRGIPRGRLRRHSAGLPDARRVPRSGGPGQLEREGLPDHPDRRRRRSHRPRRQRLADVDQVDHDGEDRRQRQGQPGPRRDRCQRGSSRSASPRSTTSSSSPSPAAPRSAGWPVSAAASTSASSSARPRLRSATPTSTPTAASEFTRSPRRRSSASASAPRPASVGLAGSISLWVIGVALDPAYVINTVTDEGTEAPPAGECPDTEYDEGRLGVPRRLNATRTRRSIRTSSTRPTTRADRSSATCSARLPATLR